MAYSLTPSIPYLNFQRRVQLAFNGFAVKALAISGHHPQLQTCTFCGEDIGTSRLFHSSLGSMVHEHCVENHPETQQVTLILHTQKLGSRCAQSIASTDGFILGKYTQCAKEEQAFFYLVAHGNDRTYSRKSHSFSLCSTNALPINKFMYHSSALLLSISLLGCTSVEESILWEGYLFEQTSDGAATGRLCPRVY